jgi:hypothetical protein
VARPPLLELFTLAVMALVAVLQLREGLFRSFLLLVNVLFAGLLAFNFWEPLARGLGEISTGLDAYADALVLVLLFCLFLGGMRLLTLYLAPEDPSYPPLVRRLGSILFGLMTGYLIAGVLICVMQTLPLHERFLWYDPDEGLALGGPDRVWLATMHRAGGVIFDLPAGRERWFDADGSFIARYTRYRRHADSGEPARNRGEFPAVLETKPGAQAKE